MSRKITISSHGDSLVNITKSSRLILLLLILGCNKSTSLPSQGENTIDPKAEAQFNSFVDDKKNP